MDDIRAITYRLEEEILNDPVSCCCVPYQQNLAVAPCPREIQSERRRLPLTETGQRVMGQQHVNLELYPGRCRRWPQMKTELRGGKLYPVCECIKRNGLQDSCPSYRCMVVFHRHGCSGQPAPSCAMGRKQLAKYAALPDRTPEYCKRDQPVCISSFDPCDVNHSSARFAG